MADLPITQQIFTTTLSNSSLTITQSFGLTNISVYNVSSTAGSVTGSITTGGIASSAISIDENESFNVTAQGVSVIDGLVITAPAGCTLNIIGLG